MADIKLDWNAAIFGADASLANGDFVQDGDLSTAVVMSIFSWRRANPDDRLPDDSGRREGFWGDSLNEDEQDKLGSRLWLLRREKLTQETINRAHEYIAESLRWIVQDGRATQVDTVVERRGLDGLSILVTI